MNPIRDVIYGHDAPRNAPPPVKAPLVSLRGRSRGQETSFGLDETQLSKHILCLGGTGSGKTNTINSIVAQIRVGMGQRDVMLVFDTKGDFQRTFYDAARGDLVLGSSAHYRDITQKWNIYRDILIDGWDDENVTLNINELTRALFEPHKSEQQPFFTNAARGIFGAYLLAMTRGAAEKEDMRALLHNRALTAFFQQATGDDYLRLTSAYPDLAALNLYIGDAANLQALGVLAEIQVMVRDTFFGVFGAEGNFSIREFIRGKGGRALFLEYDLSIGDTLAPLYSLLVDLALKETLGRAAGEGRVFIILDELKLLPHLSHLDDAVNFGRSLGMRVLAGLQSISQLYDIYKEDKARAIASGFCALFAFRPNDSVTRQYVQEQLGKNIVSETILANREPVVERRDGFAAEDWDLYALRTGEAFVALDAWPPFVFQFEKYEG